MRISIYLAVLPVFFILWYVYKKDPHKENFGHLAKTIGLGMLCALPVCILEIMASATIGSMMGVSDEGYYSSYIGLFIYVFLGVGLIEEFFKWIIVRAVHYDKKHFDETYDAMVYCIYASLGFALLENILFVIGQIKTGNDLSIAIYRAITAIPGHTCFGIIMGYYISKAKAAQFNDNVNEEKKCFRLSLIIPTLIHTIYDFLLMSGNVLFLLVWLIFIIVTDVKCIKMIRKISESNVSLNRNDEDVAIEDPTSNMP